MTAFRSALLLMSCLSFGAQAQQVPLDSSSPSSRIVFTVTQVPPQFPGGMSKLDKYLRQNLRYPEAARKAGKEGKVFVSFIVNERGGIEDVQALKRVDADLDAEAIRVVQAMPAWTPAQVDRKAVACRYNLPITFSR